MSQNYNIGGFFQLPDERIIEVIINADNVNFRFKGRDDFFNLVACKNQWWSDFFYSIRMQDDFLVFIEGHCGLPIVCKMICTISAPA